MANREKLPTLWLSAKGADAVVPHFIIGRLYSMADSALLKPLRRAVHINVVAVDKKPNMNGFTSKPVSNKDRRKANTCTLFCPWPPGKTKIDARVWAVETLETLAHELCHLSDLQHGEPFSPQRVRYGKRWQEIRAEKTAKVVVMAALANPVWLRFFNKTCDMVYKHGRKASARKARK